MEYNTSLNKLIMPEYGRHVHLMVQHAIQIKDRDERNRAAHTIIGVMGALMPQLRESPDFKHKLWDHLMIISDFKLNIDVPYNLPPRSEMTVKPEPVPYYQSYIHQKHYGKIIIDMIRETGKQEDCPQRDSLIQMMAAQMKKSYTAWNRAEINNAQIAQDIWDISDGKIKLDPDKLKFSEPVMKSPPPPPHSRNPKNKKRKPNGHNRK